MTISVSISTTGQNAASGSSIGSNITGPPANSVIVAWVSWNNSGGATCTVSDNVNGAYTAISSVITDPGSSFSMQLFAFANPAATGPTVTATFSVACTNRQIRNSLIIGANPVLPTLWNGGLQTAPGTGTDAITSGSITPNAARGMILAQSFCTGGTGASTAGTGFTSQGTSWNVIAATNGGREESLVVTSLSPVAATFTSGASAGGSNHLTLGLFLAEAGSNFKALSLTQTQSPSLSRNLGKAIAASQNQSPSTQRGVGKSVSVTQTQAAAFSRAVGKSVSVTQTQSASILRAVGKAISAAQSQSPSFSRALTKTISVTQSQTASIRRALSKVISVVQTAFASFTSTGGGPVVPAQPIHVAVSDASVFACAVGDAPVNIVAVADAATFQTTTGAAPVWQLVVSSEG